MITATTINKTIKPTPALRLEEGQLPYDALLNFYEDLGWNNDMQKVEPCFVWVSPSDFNAIYQFIIEKIPDKNSHATVGMFLVNSGPSGKNEVPVGETWLFDGWTVVSQ